VIALRRFAFPTLTGHSIHRAALHDPTLRDVMQLPVPWPRQPTTHSSRDAPRREQRVLSHFEQSAKPSAGCPLRSMPFVLPAPDRIFGYADQGRDFDDAQTRFSTG